MTYIPPEFEAVYAACQNIREELEKVLRHERTCKEPECKLHFWGLTRPPAPE